jgi:hypothetical protein
MDDSVFVSSLALSDDAVAKILSASSGELLSIAGRASVKSWENRNGREQKGLVVSVDSVTSAAKQVAPVERAIRVGWSDPITQALARIEALK